MALCKNGLRRLLGWKRWIQGRLPGSWAVSNSRERASGSGGSSTFNPIGRSTACLGRTRALPSYRHHRLGIALGRRWERPAPRQAPPADALYRDIRLDAPRVASGTERIVPKRYAEGNDLCQCATMSFEGNECYATIRPNSASLSRAVS